MAFALPIAHMCGKIEIVGVFLNIWKSLVAISDLPSSEITPGEPVKTPRPAAGQHRYETWVYIILPMVGGGLLLILLLALALILPLRSQVSLVADLMLIIFVLCPLAVCMFPFYMLMVALVYGMNVLHRRAENPLDHLENLSQTMADRVTNVTDSVNKQAINLASRFAFFDVLWDIFDRPDGQNPQEQKHDSSTEE